jgi:ribosomal protein S2
MFWKLKYKIFLIKGLNFYITKKKHATVKNLNNYLGYKLNNNYILNLNEIIFWTYILIFFLQTALRKNAKVLFATKFSFQQTVFNILIKNSRLQFQLLKVFTKWVGGCLSNFLSTRWFYLFNGIKFYKQCPNLLVILEKKAAVPFISEAYSLNIPVVSFPEFTLADSQISYLLLGGNLSLESKQNNFFYFVYLLKNMLCLELGLKKKRLEHKSAQKGGGAPKKAFIQKKKNKAYRLFGSRAFNM